MKDTTLENICTCNSLLNLRLQSHPYLQVRNTDLVHETGQEKPRASVIAAGSNGGDRKVLEF